MANDFMMNKHRINPGPGQESVWDYPRPPRVEPTNAFIQVVFNGIFIAESYNAYRVLEKFHPPVYYIPPGAIKTANLIQVTGCSFCEWKGVAHYYDVQVEDLVARKAAWYYLDSTKEYKVINEYIAFYPSKMDACYVDGEQVTPQPGDFYGGWITSHIVGTFKGEPGSVG